MSISLQFMTKELARAYFQKFEMDPALLLDGQEFKPYVYSVEKSDATVERYKQLGRVYLAVMLNEEPIGEIILKKIDRTQKHCTLGISLRSDEFKNRGYGTTAEILALEFAFHQLNMESVFADAVRKNTRSQHVLQKVGFIETSRDDSFIYYRCDKADWNAPKYP